MIPHSYEPPLEHEHGKYAHIYHAICVYYISCPVEGCLVFIEMGWVGRCRGT